MNDFTFDRSPAPTSASTKSNAGEQHQKQRDPVDAEVPRDPERADPGVLGDHLVAADTRLELVEHRRGDAEHAEGPEQPDGADRPSSPRLGNTSATTAAPTGSEHERREVREGALVGDVRQAEEHGVRRHDPALVTR